MNLSFTICRSEDSKTAFEADIRSNRSNEYPGNCLDKNLGPKDLSTVHIIKGCGPESPECKDRYKCTRRVWDRVQDPVPSVIRHKSR